MVLSIFKSSINFSWKTVKNLIASKISPAFSTLSLPKISLVDSIKINTLKQLGLIVHPISKGTRYFNLSAMNVSLLIDLETKKIQYFLLI